MSTEDKSFVREAAMWSMWLLITVLGYWTVVGLLYEYFQ